MTGSCFAAALVTIEAAAELSTGATTRMHAPWLSAASACVCWVVALPCALVASNFTPGRSALTAFSTSGWSAASQRAAVALSGSKNAMCLQPLPFTMAAALLVPPQPARMPATSKEPNKALRAARARNVRGGVIGYSSILFQHMSRPVVLHDTECQRSRDILPSLALVGSQLCLRNRGAGTDRLRNNAGRAGRPAEGGIDHGCHRAQRDGIVAQLGDPHLRMGGCGRQAARRDGLANRPEQELASVRHATGDQDQRRVDEIAEPRQGHANVFARAPHRGAAGGISGQCRRDDLRDIHLSHARLGRVSGATPIAAGACVLDDGRRARGDFEAAAVAAVTQTAIAVDGNMPQLARAAAAAAIDLAIEDQSTADAGAYFDIRQLVDTSPSAEATLAERAHIGVIIQVDRHAELAA